MKEKNNQILLLEGDTQLATALTSFLEQKGYELIHVTSAEEAIARFPSLQVEICLINIKLYGKKSGLDFAYFLKRQKNSLPFIYLGSELNLEEIQQAKRTFPAGFLATPIQKESLYTTIEIALFNANKEKQIEEEKEGILKVDDGSKIFQIPLKSIKYIQADHVYVKIKVEEGKVKYE